MYSNADCIACVLGSAVICADLVLRRVYRKDFQIVSNNGFLSASLCLSAGVMVSREPGEEVYEFFYTDCLQLFSSLYSMLPTSKSYLTKAGWSARASAYALIGLFLAGVIVICLVSGLIHRHIPSHVVDCAHSHEPELGPDPEQGSESREPARHTGDHHDHESGHDHEADGSTEHTPLLKRVEPRSFKSTPAVLQQSSSTGEPVANDLHHKRREPLRLRLTRQLTMLVGGAKPLCDEGGPCYGFSQKCGGECTKTLAAKPPTPDERSRPPLTQRQTVPYEPESAWPTDDEELGAARQDSARWLGSHPRALSEGAQQIGYLDYAGSPQQSEASEYRYKSSDSTPLLNGQPEQSQEVEGGDDQQQTQQHHHHVPQNAFLSIGLQTSLAIALHKLPEGFITYATNHASPTLGMTVFLSLFIHNISEGFAMALPLYLALHSRWKAMFWSSLLGGVSQPAGAGLAAFWIWASQKTTGGSGPGITGPSWGVYGGLFAATAGIMTCVALQLLSEGLALTHKRGLGLGFAIAGMGIMGLSFAMTA